MDRRAFLRTLGASAAVGLVRPDRILASSARRLSSSYFDLHPFIVQHPEAIFIKRTNVEEKTDSEAKKQEGLALAREIFVLADSPGIPLSHRIAVKPNLTCSVNSNYTLESGMGIVTDVDFVEGMIEGMKELGISGDQFHMIEGNCADDWGPRGYIAMAERTGANFRDLTRDVRYMEEGADFSYVDCSHGVVFKRIAYLAPVNQPDSWLINIAKFKAHGMGLTLCCKNQQGMCGDHYIHFCSGLQSQIASDFQPDVEDHVAQLHAQHLEAGVPRWDRPGTSWNSGYGMEMWGQRTCDSLSVTDTGLCIIEGIYGRDGNFHDGPWPGDVALDHMTNIVIFGKDKFRADIIGHWLGGHEPGNIGLFHIAWDRGMSNVLNPMDIPVYLWEDGVPQRIPLTELERTPLVTYYLQRDYDGQDEPYWHLVDEPFDYSPYTAVEQEHEPRPTAFVLSQNYPNPFNPSTLIEYHLPRGQHARIEVYNAAGQLTDVVLDGWRPEGAHVAEWKAQHRASGTYFYRLRTADGFQMTRRMTVVR